MLSNNTAARDEMFISEESSTIVTTEEGVINFDLVVTEGATGPCTAGDEFFLARDFSSGAFWFALSIEGTAASGWDLRVTYYDSTTSYAATAANSINEDQTYNITVTYNSTTAGIDTGSDYLRLYIDTGIDGSPDAENLTDKGTMKTDTDGELSWLDCRGGVGTCDYRMDNIWVSDDPTFDVFNHVTGGDGTYDGSGECFDSPVP
jgi:hypothetical protein